MRFSFSLISLDADDEGFWQIGFLVIDLGHRAGSLFSMGWFPERGELGFDLFWLGLAVEQTP